MVGPLAAMETQMLRCVQMMGLAAALLAAMTITVPAHADDTTTVNPATSWGTWRGWGSSLAWWANQFGSRDDMADVLYTLNTVSFTSNQGTQSLPGLGFNVVRYNAGGTGTQPINGGVSLPNNPSTIPPFKMIPTYWLDWSSSDPASRSWNWTADANQRAMMWKARDRGANVFELFSNSPPWWMCYNSSTTGSNSGTGDNLQSWNYQQFAIYMAAVAKYSKDNWGVSFTSVEPFNESSDGWWKYPGRQEGCHFDMPTQNAVIGYLRAEMDKRGLNSMPISASDENTVDRAIKSWNELTASSKSSVGQINTHGYQGGGGDRAGLYRLAKNSRKELWNSEYGENDATGMSMASNLTLDMRKMHPVLWCYWQPFDGGGWGLINSKPGDNWVGFANPKYYVLAQYTRHIRPGMTLIDGGEDNTVAAYDAANHRLVLVTTNYKTAQWINYDLSKYRVVNGNTGGKVDRWMTQTGGGDMYAHHTDTALSGKKFRSWFPTNTVQTFVVNNIY
jgi:galactan endo-1,6-beta-galactosidase